jgi:hypothetical protein
VTYQDLLTMIEDGLREAQAIKTGALPPPTPVPSYVTSPITIAKSSFLATQRFPDGRLLEQTPTFFTGYGHFAQVRKDLELFPSYGINMIQIEQGPVASSRTTARSTPSPSRTSSPSSLVLKRQISASISCSARIISPTGR